MSDPITKATTRPRRWTPPARPPSTNREDPCPTPVQALRRAGRGPAGCRGQRPGRDPWRYDDRARELGSRMALVDPPQADHGDTSCEVHHLGYAISGRLRVVMDDGQALEIPGASAYEIPPGHDASVVGDEPFVTLDWTSAHVVGLGSEGGQERILATVLFTDIVGSTAALEAMGDARWRDVLTEHNRRLRDRLNRFRGREIATTGDGFLALFDSASRAVRCGLAMTVAAATWTSRSGSGCIRARSSWWAVAPWRRGPRRCTGGSRSPAPTRSWSPRPRATSSRVPASPSRTRRPRAQGPLGGATPLSGPSRPSKVGRSSTPRASRPQSPAPKISASSYGAVASSWS